MDNKQPAASKLLIDLHCRILMIIVPQYYLMPLKLQQIFLEAVKKQSIWSATHPLQSCLAILSKFPNLSLYNSKPGFFAKYF